jgi:D-3-phosphoglycerate dehydrogenase
MATCPRPRDEYEIQFADIFDQVVAYAAGRPINVVNPAVFEVLAGRRLT